jgi:hypothetical protein
MYFGPPAKEASGARVETNKKTERRCNERRTRVHMRKLQGGPVLLLGHSQEFILKGLQ